MSIRAIRVSFVLVVSCVMILCTKARGEESQTEAVNLLPNPSFEQPAAETEERALGWNVYHCGYTRSKDRSYAPSISGPWSCKISGSGKEEEKGLGGAFNAFTAGLPEHGTFIATNRIYIASYTQGKILSVYVTVNYDDKTSQIFSSTLSSSEIAGNLNKWKTYSLIFTTDPKKEIKSIVYWCLVWEENGKKFIGTVYFDEAELKLADERTGAISPLPFSVVNRTDLPPLIDGRFNDKCWEKSIEFSPFILIVGTDLPTQQTKAYITYDQNNLYIFMNCFENILDPALQKIFEFKAEKTEHDSNVWEDDCVEVFIKPSSKEEVYYHLVVNSKGTIYDARCQNSTCDKNWNSNAEVKTLVGEKAWTVEMGIPFRSLGVVSPEIGDRWRINLCREEKPYKENSCWSPTGGSFHNPSSFGEISFDKMFVGSRITSLGNLQKGNLQKEKNYLKISLSNSGAKAEVVRAKTFVSDTASIKRGSQVDRIISPGKSENLEVEYSGDNESQFMTYQVLQDGRLLYSSPHFPFSSQTVFMHKGFIFGSEIINTYPLTEFYLVEGELLYLPLVLQTNLEKKQIKECKFVLDVPYFLRLINPMSRERMFPSPIEITEEQIRKENLEYYRYTFNFDSKNITFPKKDVVINPLLFKSRITGSELKSYKIYYQVLFNGQKKSTGEVTLFLLPPFRQKSPENIIVCNWPAGSFFDLFDQLSEEEKSEIVKLWKRAGFTIHGYYRESIKSFAKKYKLKLHDVIVGNAVGGLTDLCYAIPDIAEHLRKYPQYRAVTANGNIKYRVVSPAYLLEPGCPIRNKIKEYVGKLALEYPALMWDYEVPVTRPESIGFSEMNLELFRKFAGISQDVKLTPEIVLRDYLQKWIDFRCYQNAEIAKLLQEGIKEHNPDCLFSVYSGYQGDFTRETYGVDWKYMSKYVDRVWCGYGRPVEMIEDTLKAINGKPLIGGELVWIAGGGFYDQDKIEVNLFRRLTDSGGGVMVFYDWIVDGRFYKAISQVASVSADFEKFFKNYSRDDSLAKVLIGEKENIAILRNGSERLLFLFNSNQSPQIFKIENLNLSPNMVGIDYQDKKIVNLSPFLEISVPANKVKVIHLRDKMNNSVPSTPDIISPLNEKIKDPIPFLIWKNKDAGDNIYELEYSLDPKFPEATTKRIPNLSVNYYKIREPLVENSKYYWRVRAIDVATGKKSSFSNIGTFSIDPLLNADIYPLCFSPNNDGKYDAVTFKAKMRKEAEWTLNILDKENKVIKAFSGEGEKVYVLWDGKDNKDRLVPEGTYTLLLEGKGNVLYKEKVELNMRFGRSNPAIEEWCSWSSTVLNDALAEKDYNTFYDNYPYSLMLKGSKEDSSAYWSNYRTGIGIPVIPGKEYIYSAYIKSEMENKGQVKISLHFFTKNNRWAAIPGLDEEWKGIEAELKGKNDWTKLTVSCKAPDNAAKAILFFSLKGVGKAWMGAVEFGEK